MPAGKVAPNKTRTNITIEKELKSQLEEQAKKAGRSFNNLIINILKEHGEKTRQKYQKLWGNELYNNVMKLHEADKNAH